MLGGGDYIVYTCRNNKFNINESDNKLTGNTEMNDLTSINWLGWPIQISLCLYTFILQTLSWKELAIKNEWERLVVAAILEITQDALHLVAAWVKLTLHFVCFWSI